MKPKGEVKTIIFKCNINNNIYHGISMLYMNSKVQEWKYMVIIFSILIYMCMIDLAHYNTYWS